MKYFLDTEFIEDFHKPFLGKKRHYIDLISIGIVAEDGREYYAVSNEFDVDKVWNRWDRKRCCHIPEMCTVAMMGECPGYKREYWLRDNVLKPIHAELAGKEGNSIHEEEDWFTLKALKTLIKKYGKSNKQIAADIVHFIDQRYLDPKHPERGFIYPDAPFSMRQVHTTDLEFYGYYADYDWVLLCSLFGRMIDLPKGFPMYCHDLKQSIDRVAKKWQTGGTPEQNYEYKKECDRIGMFSVVFNNNFDDMLKLIKSHRMYPAQPNKHNALADAQWNKKLFDHLNLMYGL